MAKPKRKEFIDANGRRIVQYPNGESRIYERWQGNEDKPFIEVTDKADVAVGRMRFIPAPLGNPITNLMTRENEIDDGDE